MTPLAVAVILACIVALTVVLISMLISFKRAAQRAEGVLAIVEREIRPMTTELENLVSLCRRHHRAVHEEGWRIHIVDGIPVVEPPP